MNGLGRRAKFPDMFHHMRKQHRVGSPDFLRKLHEQPGISFDPELLLASIPAHSGEGVDPAQVLITASLQGRKQTSIGTADIDDPRGAIGMKRARSSAVP